MRDKDIPALREMFQYSTLVNKGRMAAPNWMNFWKGSKGGGHFQSENLLFEHEIDTKEYQGFNGMFFHQLY